MLIHGDRWLENNAEVHLKNLFSRKNFFDITFSTFQPASPDIDVYVCNKLSSSFKVKPDLVQRVYLSGSCEPRVVRFEVKNGFVPGGEDKRVLGGKIESLKVSSLFKVPILNFSNQVFYFLCILIIPLVAFYAFKQSLSISILSSFLASFTLAYSALSNVTLFALALLVLMLLVGVIVFNTDKSSSLDFDEQSINFSLLAFCIFFFALLIRFYNLDFGLPNNYHPDEVPKFNAIMRMRQYGDLNPRYFLHPSMLLYMTYFMNSLFRFIGLFDGLWESHLIFSGRVGSALAGSFSVLFTALIGKHVFSKKVGLISGLILSLLPLHVTCSRYVKEDALLTFFVLISIYFLIRAVKEDKAKLLLVSGFFGGVAASTKYTGILTFVIILSAPFLRYAYTSSDKIRSIRTLFAFNVKYFKWTVCALFFLLLGFVLCSPYTVLDSKTFLKDFAHEQNHMNKGHSILISAWSQLWMYHWERSLLPGMTTLFASFSVIGLGMFLKSYKRTLWFVFCLFLLFYLPSEWVKAKPAPQPERYVLPCLPFLSLAAAFSIIYLLKLKNKVLNLLIILAFFILCFRTFSLSYEIGQDTRAKMEHWMKENIKKGSSVYIDWKPYSVRFWNEEFKQIYLPRSRIIPSLSVSELKKAKVDYLVLSSLFYDRYFSQPGVDPALREQIRNVFRSFEKVKEFEPKFGTYGFHNPKLTLFKLK